MSDATSPHPARPDDEVLRLRSQVSTLNSQNERLVRTLRDARSQIVTLKSEVDRLGQPPATYGVLLETFADGTADIMTAGRKMRVAVSPALATDDLEIGREVMLNESLNIVAVHRFEVAGEVVLVKELLDHGTGSLVLAHADEERVVRMVPLIDTAVRVGDASCWSPGPVSSSSGSRSPRWPTSCSRRCRTSPTRTSGA